MLRVYLMLMFVVPVLELWDRWVARFAQPLQYDGAYRTDRWLQVIEGQDRPLHFCRVWLVRIPWMRTWDYQINCDDYGWCLVFLMHATGHGWKVLHPPAPPFYEPRPPWRGV